MPEVSEYAVNVKLAEILSRDLGIDARAERVKNRRRPDIRCYYRGLIISIEASYSRDDAERDAGERVKQGLADIAIALWLKNKYRDIPEEELERAIRSSTFDVKVFVPREVAGTLIQFLEKGVKKRAEPATGWFIDIDIPTLGTIISSAVEFLAKEEEVKRLIDEVKGKIGDFVNTMRDIDNNGQAYSKIYGVLYRLYGLSIAEARDPEVVFGQAALSILLSATIYEHVRNIHKLEPLSSYLKKHGAIEGLKKAIENLLAIDYRAAVETTLNILGALPPGAAHRVKDLAELGIKIAQSPSLLRRDFAGRVYHEITGDIALRKGFATFYTEVPAAYLLATLAVEALLDLDVRDVHRISADEAREIVNRIRSVKVGDLACGSGTLLTASYSVLHRLATILKYYHDLEDVDLREVAKTVIEEGIYGIDALRYASQITALNLTLISPGNISRENVYTIYLGYIPQKGQAWLGSLELLNNSERVGGLLAWIEGGLKGVAERVSLEGTGGVFEIPRGFDLIIMNPPFTRATGRSEEFSRERGLFGFISNEAVRKELLKAYEGVRDRVRGELRSIAGVHASVFPDVIKGLISGRSEFDQYLSIGQAGEGLLFLYLAYKYVKDRGVIAFVLPRALLAGVSWFLARVLLVSKFHVKYIVVSSDAEKGYNFSEGTSLSETLIVARKTDSTSGAGDDAETVFINLLRKPSTSLEALMLAEEVKRVARDLKANETRVVEVGDSSAMVLKVTRRQLLENVDNWNRFVAIPDQKLIDLVVNRLLGKGEIVFGRSMSSVSIIIPLARLNNILSTMGIDRHQFHDHFSRVNVHTPYPIVYGGEEDVRLRMAIRPNAFAAPKTSRADEIFRRHAARILIPDRIRWGTAHVVALYSVNPVISNIFYAVNIRADDSIRTPAEKALVLWLNTTWGILTVLFNRQETEGGWTSLKMAQWRLLPVLDVTRLEPSTLGRLAGVFDKYCEKTPARIPQQFNPENPDPVRLGIDMDFLKALGSSLDEAKAKEALLDLYRHVHNALTTWIGD